MENKYCLSSQETIRTALKKMDQWAVKTVYITNDKGGLIGSLSDGDIRRSILEEITLTTSVSQVMNRNPKFVIHSRIEKDTGRELMLRYKIPSIPILDNDGKILKILFWNELFDDNSEVYPNLNLPVVIMAGGKGTRMKPFTHIMPKPLIPVGEKSMLEVIMDEYKKYGSDQFFLTVNFKKNLIKAYFEDIKEYNISYIEEDSFYGTAGSLKYLEGKFKSPFFVSNCDILIKGQYDEMLEYHLKGNYFLTMIASMQHFEVPYGVCEIENGGDLKEISEKPSFDFLVNTGMYILNPEALQYIPENEFFHITHLMEKLKSEGQKVGVFPVSEKSWIDVGQWSELTNVLKTN